MTSSDAEAHPCNTQSFLPGLHVGAFRTSVTLVPSADRLKCRVCVLAQPESLQRTCNASITLLCASFAGLELYENVLSPDEQTNMIHIIEDWVVQVCFIDPELLFHAFEMPMHNSVSSSVRTGEVTVRFPQSSKMQQLSADAIICSYSCSTHLSRLLERQEHQNVPGLTTTWLI